MGSSEGNPATVGLVLAGGGARGAYEIGALSALLPVLEERGERPRVFVGTSVGALNSSYLAATADRPIADVMVEGERIWLETGYRSVLSPLLTLRSFGLGLRFSGQLLGIGRAHARSILDPEPLEATLKRLIPIERLSPNVASGAVRAAAVVATSALTSRTVVFHEGGGAIPVDDKRGIAYVPSTLGIDHVRASAAIPAIFPSVHLDSPEQASGWYFDGGTRLNTPIKPALKLGAGRVIVIALDSLDPGPTELAGEREPDAVEGIGQFLQATLVDPMLQDVQTLAGHNEAAGSGASDRDTVPYILVGPEKRGEIGEAAMRVYNEHYRGLGASLFRSRDLSVLARMVDGGSDPIHGSIMSLLFFAPEFAQELLRLGRRDAERWLAATHEDGPWETGPPG